MVFKSNVWMTQQDGIINTLIESRFIIALTAWNMKKSNNVKKKSSEWERYSLNKCLIYAWNETGSVMDKTHLGDILIEHTV